jgi:hypothetical protein
MQELVIMRGKTKNSVMRGKNDSTKKNGLEKSGLPCCCSADFTKKKM